MPVWEHEHVCCFEVDFRLLIRNKVILKHNSAFLHLFMDMFQNRPPVLFAVIRSAHDDQSIIAAPGQDLPKRGGGVFASLVRLDPTEEEDHSIPFANDHPQS